jgi:hypothetical protein
VTVSQGLHRRCVRTRYWVNLTAEGVRPVRQFLLTNALYNLFGHAVTVAAGGKRLPFAAYSAMSIALMAFSFAVLIGWSIKNLGVPRASIFLGCLSLTTLDYTLVHWGGKTDALVVAVYTIVFFGRRDWRVLALGFGTLVMLHREQALALALIHCVVLFLEDRLPVRQLAGVAVGVVVGALAVQGYLHHYALDHVTNRLDYLVADSGLRVVDAARKAIDNLGAGVATVLFGAWWLLFRMTADRRTWLVLGLALIVAAGVPIFTYDYSRVANVLAMPVSFVLAERVTREWREGTGLPASAVAILAVIALLGFEVRNEGGRPLSTVVGAVHRSLFTRPTMTATGSPVPNPDEATTAPQ